MIEEWRPTAELGHLYEVSSLGRVRRSGKLDCIGRPICRKTLRTYSQGRYQSIHLRDGGRCVWLVHRLVATAFIPNPLNLPQVNHKNADRLDNRAVNLEWVTRQENMKHGSRLGLLGNPAQRIRVTGTPVHGGPPLEFESGHAADMALGPSGARTGAVGTCVRRGRGTAYGYRWSRA